MNARRGSCGRLGTQKAAQEEEERARRIEEEKQREISRLREREEMARARERGPENCSEKYSVYSDFT